jgi:hypothetical protein
VPAGINLKLGKRKHATSQKQTKKNHVRVSAASSARDTDFMAKLIDVWPNGFAQRLIDGMVRARFREWLDRPALIEPGASTFMILTYFNLPELPLPLRPLQIRPAHLRQWTGASSAAISPCL